MPKSAFVALVGRPSSGKSTLLNRLCGQMVAITSPVPQTTRNAIRGIVNRSEGQLVFVDTPGLHLSEKKLNKRLAEIAQSSAADADIVLYLIDAAREPAAEEEAVAKMLKGREDFLIAAINKIDAKGADEKRAAAFVRKKFPSLKIDDDALQKNGRVFSISALTGDGIEALLSALFSLAPEGESFYPPEYYTDQEIDFRIAEIIRGEAMNRLRQELPHSIYVEVADTELRASPGAKDGEKKRLWVRAFIVCERESQKGMIVGKGGALIKQIGEASRKKLNGIFDWRIELDLRVKTGKDWRTNSSSV